MYDRKNPATKDRVARILGRLTLRTGGFFAIAVCVEALTLYSNIFGTVPVIPAAFYACVNLVLALITLVFVIVVLAARFAGLRTNQQFWVGFLATVFADYFGFWMVFAVLTGNPLPGL